MAATVIKDDQSRASSVVVYSNEVTDVTNIDIQAVSSAGATGVVNFTCQRATTNGAWRPVLDENGNEIKFTMIDAVDNGVNLVGVNAAKFRVKCEILEGGSGTFDLEYESIS